MSIFREIPPTAGFPLHFADLLRGACIPGRLEKDFKQYLGASYAQITYSGTAAFYFILESLKNISGKKTVIIPSFVCPLLALAIHRAGLIIEVCDINPDNFGFDLNALQNICAQNQDILAIVPVHLGGLPVDMEALLSIARPRKIFIIEDCAQSLGALYNGKPTGSMGDFSFFSLCRGKGLTIYEGGMIIANKPDFVDPLVNTTRRLMKNDFFSEAVKIWELFGYWIFYRPQLFWFVFRLPQKFWEWQGRHLKAVAEEFSTDFPIHRVSDFRNSVGHAAFHRLDSAIKEQRKKAYFYIDSLSDTNGIALIPENSNSKACYPFFSLIFKEPALSLKSLEILNNNGLGGSRIYDRQISEYEYLSGMLQERDYPRAKTLAQNCIALSTSAFLKTKELEKIVGIIREVCQDKTS